MFYWHLFNFLVYVTVLHLLMRHEAEFWGVKNSYVNETGLTKMRMLKRFFGKVLRNQMQSGAVIEQWGAST